MTSKTPVPARLFVLLAREAPVGVIIRRGPTDWVQLIHWDTKKDIFTPGQWFHGRIYEHKSDISPNGKLMVYCAYKRNNRLEHPDYGDSWTAISKPPYFTALALWPHHNEWGGGGFFIRHNTMLLNHLDDNREPHPKQLPTKRFEVIQADEYSIMSASIFPYTQLRDGWKPLDNDKMRYGFQSTSFLKRVERRGRNDIFIEGLWSAKVNATPIRIKGSESARLACSVITSYPLPIGLGVYRHSRLFSIPKYEYRLLDEINSLEILLKDATWADFDQRGRLVLAKEGKLFSATLENGELVLTELADFNAHKPEAIESPASAKKW